MKFFAMPIFLSLMVCSAYASDQIDTLKRIKERQTITLGVRDSSIPFSYLDEKQVHQGYSVELCMKIVGAVKKQLKLSTLNVKYTSVTPATRMHALEDGAIDLECGSTTNNADRQKQIVFAPTTFVSGSRLLSKKSSKVSSFADLSGKIVVSIEGTTNLNQLNALNIERNFGMKVVTAKDNKEAFDMVDRDQATAFFMDDILLASLVATSKTPDDFELTKKALSVEPYGIMLRKDDTGFANVVDATIKGLMKSGEIKTIYAKWFQERLPGKGINLNLPMSDHLMAAIANPTNSSDPGNYATVPEAQKIVGKK